ncbi:hypothetical protein HRU45_00715 [Candidatus Dependentiae bacterium]|nr:hypothetical protein [Candidatus Dependentiae bacterium]
MEAFKVLEDKVSSLVKLVETLRVDKDKLTKENEKIKARYKSVEASHSVDSKRVTDLGKERELTKLAVDDLIKSINSLVEGEAL